MHELTYLGLFNNSAVAEWMNALASAVRRSEKAGLLFIADGLMGQRFCIG